MDRIMSLKLKSDEEQQEFLHVGILSGSSQTD